MSLVVAPRAVAAGRTLTVTPASSLTDQAVQVTWSGFTPTTPEGLNQVVVVQCGPSPTSLADCFTDQPFPNSANGNEVVDGVTGPDGTGRARFEVRPAAQLPKLGCNQAQPCTILAFENQVVPDGQMPVNAAIAPIAFARSTADCPSVSKFDVRVEGEASAAPVLYDWAARRCTGTNKLVVDVTETSSDSGRQDFLHGLVDVGLTSLPATPEELAAAPNHPDLAYAPIDLTALAVVFNLKDPLTNQPIQDLTLTPRLLARLVSDTDLFGFFQDPEFVRLNPSHTFPGNGVSPPLIRAEGNADTWLATNWMASDPRSAAFLKGHDPEGIPVNTAFQDVAYPTSIFENRALDDAYLPRQGQYQVATHVFYGARPADTSPLDPASVGFIGLVDLASARRFDLPVAKLVNAAGRAVAPDLDTILAGYHAMKAGADSTLVADPTSTDAAAYPLVKVDYAVVPTRPSATLLGPLGDLLTWGVTTGQQGLPDGVVPLPSELVDQTRRTVAALGAPADPAPTGLGGAGTFGDLSCCSSGGYGSSSFSDAAAFGEAAAATASPTPAAAAAKAARRVALVSAAVADAGAPLILPLLILAGLVAGLLAAGRVLWPRVSARAGGRRGPDDLGPSGSGAAA